MDHHVDVTRTHNDNPSVPDSFHLRCRCGWTSSAHDEATVEQVTQEHLAVGDPAPVPSTVSPD